MKIDEINSPVYIGRLRETGVMTIEFDVSAWDYPGVFSIEFKHDNLPDSFTLPPTQHRVVDGILSIDIKQNLTANAGRALMGVKLMDGTTVVKYSPPITIVIEESLTSGTGTPPEPIQEWIDGAVVIVAQATAAINTANDNVIESAEFTGDDMVFTKANAGQVVLAGAKTTLKGDKGASAYEVWLQAGNTGTEANYIAFLKQEAVAAASVANSAATNANTKAGLADTAAINANTKAGLADAAATLANTKAGLAVTAATAANNAAGLTTSAINLANEAALNADVKAGLANTAANNANTKAGLANTAAGLANDKAALANTKAGLADTAALNANSKADLANTATIGANYMAGQAEAAALLANAKASAIDTSADNANAKAVLANDAAILANAKADLANNAAAWADSKSDLANAAAANANTKAGLADTAATLANSKAGLADTAAINANTKAGLADTAATNANTKAGLADTAATNANTKAGLANDAATLANTKAGLADTKATLANDAADLANTKAGLADTAAINANASALAAQNNLLWRRTTTNPASFYPVPQSPLYVRASGEPIQSGTGDPAPDNIRPILPWKASGETVKVKRTGKNLFDKANATQILAVYIGADGVSHQGAARSIFIPCLPNITYTVRKTAGQRFSVGYTIELPEVTVATFGFISSHASSSISITTGADAKYLIAYIYNSTYDTTITAEAMIDSVQIELGSVVTPYEPYSGEEITLTAPQDIYSGWLDNEGNGVVQYRKTVFDGTENWATAGTPIIINTQRFYLNSPALTAGFNNAAGACSHAKLVTTGSPTNDLVQCAFSANYFYIRVPWSAIGVTESNTAPEQVAALKAYLEAQYSAGTPLTVVHDALLASTPLTPAVAPLTALPQLDRITPRQNVVATDAQGLQTDYAKSPIQESNEVAQAIIG